MSKFFNDTRNVQNVNPVPATANVDIQQLVGALKQNLEGNGSSHAHSTEMDLKHLLQPLKNSPEVAAEVVARRLLIEKRDQRGPFVGFRQTQARERGLDHGQRRHRHAANAVALVNRYG
jgi:hypothetical protein